MERVDGRGKEWRWVEIGEEKRKERKGDKGKGT